MNEFNQKHAYDNFDKEFNRTARKKTNALTGKIPRWGLGVLAGILLVGAGIFHNKFSRTESAQVPRSAESQANIIIPTSDDTLSPQAAVLNITTGDEQADSDEFAAVMASKTGKSVVVPSDTVYTLKDTSYNVSVEELPVSESGEAVIAKNADETNENAATNDSVVVWIDRTPFQIHFEKMADVPAGNIEETDTTPVIQIEGHPYALHMENSPQSESDASGNPVFSLDEQPVSITVEDMETKSPSNGNWFVQVFHSLFGENEPTAMPTVIHVTVIVETTATMTEVPTAAPTATPEILPTEEVKEKGPIRLDAKSIEDDLVDAPLFDDSLEEEDDEPAVSVNQNPSQPSDAAAALAEGTAIPVYVDQEPQPIVRTIEPEAPLYAEADELPETGMAEDWNIPMLLTAVAVLLGIIILARRLRRRG